MLNQFKNLTCVEINSILRQSTDCRRVIDKYSEIAHVLDPVVHKKKFMTRTSGGGGGGVDEDNEGLQKFLDTRREGSEKIVGLEGGL